MKPGMNALLSVGLAIVLTGGCGGGRDVITPELTPKPTPPGSPSTTLPAMIESVGGSPLGVWPLGTVAPFTSFRVLSLQKRPVAEVAVQCSVSGGGSIAKSVAMTDSAGVASCGEWILSVAPGFNTVQASVASVAPLNVTIEGVRASADLALGRYRLEQFNGGPVPGPFVEDERGVQLELVEAELVMTPGAFELFWTVRVPGRVSSAPIRTTGTVTAVGLRWSLVVSSSTSYFNDTWGLPLSTGELLLAGDDESWPLGPSGNVFRLVH